MTNFMVINSELYINNKHFWLTGVIFTYLELFAYNSSYIHITRVICMYNSINVTIFCHRNKKIQPLAGTYYPAGIYLLKVNIRNTRARCEIYSKLTIKIPERRRRRSGIFIVNFEHISHLVLVFLFLTLKM